MGGGVQLGSLGTSATDRPIVPDDGEYGGETCPSANLSTTNPTWPDTGSNTGRRGGKPATNRLSYGATITRNVSTPLNNIKM
jgi:general stress protein YciG